MAKSYISAFLGLSMLAACGSSSDPKSRGEVEAGGTVATRTCFEELTESNKNSLATFFSVIVKNLEGPPTACIELSGSGTAVTGTLRVEYEDDYGIRYIQFNESDKYYGKLEQVDDVVSLELIFIDNAGFTQVKGSSHVDDQFTSAEVRYYLFPSQEEAIDQAAEEAAEKCRDGTYTVAQCMGYGPPPAQWWNQPFYPSYATYLVSLAQGVLADTTKSKKLGTMRFDLSRVLTQ